MDCQGQGTPGGIAVPRAGAADSDTFVPPWCSTRSSSRGLGRRTEPRDEPADPHHDVGMTDHTAIPDNPAPPRTIPPRADTTTRLGPPSAPATLATGPPAHALPSRHPHPRRPTEQPQGRRPRPPLGELHVVTGVSGSGKSSLAFDTVYSEGQRRYVETFSSYARQFLDRMDKPRVDAIDGIPPAIAIDQTNPVRTSRSTVGTMTELNDHLKLLFARAAVLHCRGCGAPVRRDTPGSILDALRAAGLDRVMVTFEVKVPEGSSPAGLVELLASQGYTRVHRERPDRIEVIQDRFRLGDGGGAPLRRTCPASPMALSQGTVAAPAMPSAR